MRPFVALAFVLGSALSAPSVPLPAWQGLGYANLAAAPLAAALPAPYSTQTQAEGVITVHQPAPIVQKEVHYGQTSYISGYATAIHKPPTPHLPIQVPTVLRGSQTFAAPIVKTQTQIHTVNEPVFVERRVEVPYDVPVLREQIVEVPTPVHVDAPYNVPHPVPVAGEPIIRKTVAAPIITHSHHQAVAAPLGYAVAPLVAAH